MEPSAYRAGVSVSPPTLQPPKARLGGEHPVERIPVIPGHASTQKSVRVGRRR